MLTKWMDLFYDRSATRRREKRRIRTISELAELAPPPFPTLDDHAQAVIEGRDKAEPWDRI
jgi:hypothetical protein